MNDKQIRKQLKTALDRMQPKEVPQFDEVWTAAERRHAESRRRRLRAIGGVAAASVVIAITLSLWPARQTELENEYAGDFLTADALLNSISWPAPSDSLMPEHQFDIYEEVPFLNMSTTLEEGWLL